MRLRQLFEAKTNEVAIIFGRFNPPHQGHKAAWETAATKDEWYVGTNESTVGPKDPLPYEVKVEAMKTIWPDVAGHIVAETSWLTLASYVYEKHGKVKLIIVTDESWVVPTIQEYNGKSGPHGSYNFPEIRLYHDSIDEAKLALRKSSATSLRDAVAKGDRQAFSDAAGVSAETPVMGKPFFDLVAEYLLPYQEKIKAKAEKAKKKTNKTEKEKTTKVRDRKTGKEYDPDEEFDKLKNSPEFQAQMKRMATKEGLMPGWMLKADPELGRKVKDAKTRASAVKKFAGKHVIGIDYILAGIAQDEDWTALYKIHTDPKNSAERYISNMIDDMYQEIAADLGAHADDDFEKIYDEILDRIIDKYEGADLSNDGFGDPDER